MFNNVDGVSRITQLYRNTSISEAQLFMTRVCVIKSASVVSG